MMALWSLGEILLARVSLCGHGERPVRIVAPTSAAEASTCATESEADIAEGSLAEGHSLEAACAVDGADGADGHGSTEADAACARSALAGLAAPTAVARSDAA